MFTETKRGKCLLDALNAINSRFDVYGEPEDCFSLIANLWSAYLTADTVFDGVSVVLTPHDVACMMALFKIARMKTGEPHDDNYIDACGYLSLAADIAKTASLATEAPVKITSVAELLDRCDKNKGCEAPSDSDGAIHGLGLKD